MFSQLVKLDGDIGIASMGSYYELYSDIMMSLQTQPLPPFGIEIMKKHEKADFPFSNDKTKVRSSSRQQLPSAKS